ncbi:MAG TPA: TerB family tellurite resistance protein [Labilithrix sp.]|nr:TerB family tellurite resistance protein [Labilithrix sp.]
MSSIAKLLTAPIQPKAEADRVLELAFLMSAVDGHLADEEVEAFRELVGLARGVAPTKDEVDGLIEQFVVAAHAVGVDERVRHVARAIRKDLREDAFKIAVGLSLVDHDESEHEDELIGILAATMELAERAIPLAREARAAVRADEGE